MQLSDVDFHDIQGLVRFGHGHLSEACFHLLRVKNARRARSWLAGAPVSHAVKDGLPPQALQVAFTCEGLAALGVTADVLEQFSHEFRTGMHELHRARRLGDVNHNGPDAWRWGNAASMPHVLVMIYGIRDTFADWQKTVKGREWNRAFEAVHEPLETKDIGPREHFGFVDGTSQPKIDWDRNKSLRRREVAKYGNVAALGEFLLGYPNEYDRYTTRPVVEDGDDPDGLLPLAEDLPGKRDFGRNGTFLVFRDLEQDVAAFWRTMYTEADGDAGRRRRLGGKLVGRMLPDLPVIPSGYNIIPNDDPGWVIPDAAPIAKLNNLPVAGTGPDMEEIWLNQFTYQKDAAGTACPHGAHIRRANPRTGDLPGSSRNMGYRFLRMLGFGDESGRDDLVASTRFHRIVRRGREYGPELPIDKAIRSGNGKDKRGLRFICLNANISRQFEFVQASWLEHAKFDGLNDSDPLLGSRNPARTGEATDGFEIPQDSGRTCRLNGLPQFVTLRGGAYFFLPGLRAMKFIAAQK